MSVWFVLILASALMSFVLPIVGATNQECVLSKRFTFVISGLVLCSTTLIFVFTEISGYISANDTASLLDTIGVWSTLAIIFSVCALVVGIICFFRIVRQQS